jgi:menaquinol-cytochrome c reductase iron-sulfur subunit
MDLTGRLYKVEVSTMNERMPKKISRRSFLSTSGKLALGAKGILAGSASLFYYGAITQKKRPLQERPGNIVELGVVSQLSAIKGVEKVSYEGSIQDAWVTKAVNGFVYVRNDPNGELLIISPICTHLGCIINPVPEAVRGGSKGLFFLCPCHGAEFDISGNAVGVILQGLDTFKPIISKSSVYIDLLDPIKGQIRKQKQ